MMDDINYNGLNPKGTKDLRIEHGFSGGVFAYQNTLKFILGDRDLAEYDKFVQELDSQGVGQYLEIANKTYKKYKEQP